MTISKRLDIAMREAGFKSQSSLHRASGVPQPTINRILKGAGTKGPESDTLKKLAIACNVNFDWLNEGRGEKLRGAAIPSATPESAMHNQAPPLPIEANIQAVIEMMQSTDDRGRQKIRLAAEDALAEHKAHLLKAGINTGSKIANAVLNMTALTSSKEVFSKKEEKEKP